MHNSDEGYSITEHVFERQQMHRVSQALFAADLARTKAGARHVPRIPAVRAVAEHPTLIDLAATFIGGTPIPFRATLFDKAAASNWLVAWHQDTALPATERIDDASWGPWSVKGGFCTRLLRPRRWQRWWPFGSIWTIPRRPPGPLRVLPGTHTRGVLPHDEIRQLAAAATPAICVAPAGGVVAMRPLVVDASSKARDDQPRRVLHIEFAASVCLGTGFELAVG